MKTEASWWPPDAQDHELIVFFVLVSTLGITSTLIGFIALGFKYNANDIMSKTGHSFCGCNAITVYFGLIYVAVAAGAIYVSYSNCSLGLGHTLLYFHIHKGGANLDFLEQHAIKYLGDAGLRCTGDAMKSYRACAMMLGIAVSTGVGALVALFNAILEALRIRQWNRVLKRCKKY